MSTNDDKREIQWRIVSAIEVAVNDWFRRQCMTPEVQMYLYYKPGTIAFWIGPEPLNDEWVLVEGARIRNDITPTILTSHVFDAAKRLPIWTL